MADIKLFRKDNNLSQTKLAEILDCTQGFISSIENGGRPIPDNIITKLLSFKKYNNRHLIDKKKEIEGNDVTMSREVFDVIKNLSETVFSQQRSIEQMLSNSKKDNAKDATCANVSGSDLVK